MNIIVCIKQVPEVADAELELDDGELDLDDLVMGINEWDNYAVEEAVRLKEAHGGAVTVVTIGEEEAEEVLRRALAMGADAAVLVDGDDFAGSDALGIARGLAAAVKDLPFDLILTGAMSSDTGWGQVGVALAELLGLPCASLAVQLSVEDGEAVVHRELESNTHEVVKAPLPMVVTVQTGINTPRYVSIMGIRKTRSVEIRERDADDLGLDEDLVGQDGSSVATRQLAFPPRGVGGELLTGTMDQICERAAEIIREKGGLA